VPDPFAIIRDPWCNMRARVRAELPGLSAMTTPPLPIQMRDLGLVHYTEVWLAMKSFTTTRIVDTPDEIWCVQHPPVYTQGLNCSVSTLAATDIPIIKTDRGGQITYHGPGQLVTYLLFDLKRRRRGAKWLVNLAEQSIIDFLGTHHVTAHRLAGAPGVYVSGKKIAALGLRIRHGASYHGISFNVDMDLTPFQNIDPCGFENLEVTQLKDLGVTLAMDEVRLQLGDCIVELLDAP